MSNILSLSHTRKAVLAALLAVPLAVALLAAHTSFATSGACTAPSTSYGTVTSTISVPATGTYRIWTRMSAPSTSANTYMLQIDGANCYTIGGSTVPVYASGATTFFANNTSNWIHTTTAGTSVDVSLAAGSHSFELIGNAAGVVVDRLVLTQDLSCPPTGTGVNCSNPPDTTNPVVSITAPANNASLTSTTTVTANATDDVAVKQVEFLVDGVVKSTDTSSPYSYSLDPSTLTVGSHQLTAIAVDTSNNQTTSSVVNVTVPDTTAPTVALTSPASGATVSGTINVTGTASDNVGVTSVNLRVDNVYVATDNTSPYSLPLDTTGLTNGTHSVVLRAFDAAGNSTDTTAINITVNNVSTPPPDTTPPTVSVSSPANGATISGTTALAVAASDSSGIDSVAFYVDGVQKSSDTSAPYGYSLDTTTLSNGTHTIKATATDSSTNHNVGTSATITVTVANTVYDQGDINKDGKVNLQDFSLLVGSQFPRTGTCVALGRADINCDGNVNLQDFSLLVGSKFPR